GAQGECGGGGDPGGGGEVAAPLGDEVAPGGQRGLEPEAEEAQRALHHDGGGDGGERVGADGGQHVGDDLGAHDAQRPGAHVPGGLDVVVLADRDRRGAGQPGEGRDGQPADQQPDGPVAGAGERDDRHDQDERGERQDEVGEDPDGAVHHPAQVAGDDAEEPAGHQAEGDGHRADDQRRPASGEGAGEDVPADRVGAEPVPGGGRLQDRGEVGAQRVEAGQQG